MSPKNRTAHPAASAPAPSRAPIARSPARPAVLSTASVSHREELVGGGRPPASGSAGGVDQRDPGGGRAVERGEERRGLVEPDGASYEPVGPEPATLDEGEHVGVVHRSHA